MKVIFEISDTVIAENEDVNNDQPWQVEIEVPDDWVQLTYNGLRSAPDGDHIAHFDEDGWWHYDNMKFSDVIIVR